MKDLRRTEFIKRTQSLGFSFKKFLAYLHLKWNHTNLASRCAGSGPDEVTLKAAGICQQLTEKKDTVEGLIPSPLSSQHLKKKP